MSILQSFRWLDVIRIAASNRLIEFTPTNGSLSKSCVRTYSECGGTLYLLLNYAVGLQLMCALSRTIATAQYQSSATPFEKSEWNIIIYYCSRGQKLTPRAWMRAQNQNDALRDVWPVPATCVMRQRECVARACRIHDLTNCVGIALFVFEQVVGGRLYGRAMLVKIALCTLSMWCFRCFSTFTWSFLVLNGRLNGEVSHN